MNESGGRVRLAPDLVLASSVSSTAVGRALVDRGGEWRKPSEWAAFLDTLSVPEFGQRAARAEPEVWRQLVQHLDVADPDVGVAGAALAVVADGVRSRPPRFDLAHGWRPEIDGDDAGVRWNPDLDFMGYEIEQGGTGAYLAWGPEGPLSRYPHDEVEAALGEIRQHAGPPLSGAASPAELPVPGSKAEAALDAALAESGLFAEARRQIEERLGSMAAPADLDLMARDRARMYAELPENQDRVPGLAEAVEEWRRPAANPEAVLERYSGAATEEFTALEAYDAARRDVVAASRGLFSRRRIENTLDQVIEGGVDAARLQRELRRAKVPPALIERLRRAATAWRSANRRTVQAVDSLAETYGRHRIPAEALEGVAGLRRTVMEIARQVNPGIAMQAVARLVGSDPDALRRSGVADGKPRDVAGMFDRLQQTAKASLDITRFDPVDTAFHEAWHSLEPVLNESEQRILALDYPATGTLDHREAVAYAFGEWAAGKHRGSEPAHRAFAKVARFAGRLANWIDGHGFAIAEDVFTKAYGGDLGRRFARQARRDPGSVRAAVPLAGERDGPWSPQSAGDGVRAAAGREKHTGGSAAYKATPESQSARQRRAPAQSHERALEADLAARALAAWNGAGFAVDARLDAKGKRVFEVRSGGGVAHRMGSLAELLAQAPPPDATPSAGTASAAAPGAAKTSTLGSASAYAPSSGVRYAAVGKSDLGSSPLGPAEVLARIRVLEEVPGLDLFPQAAPDAVVSASLRNSRETIVSMAPETVLRLLHGDPGAAAVMGTGSTWSLLPESASARAAPAGAPPLAREDLLEARRSLAAGTAPLPRIDVRITPRGASRLGVAMGGIRGDFVRPGSPRDLAEVEVYASGSMTSAVATAMVEREVPSVPVRLVLSEQGFGTRGERGGGLAPEPRWGRLAWRPERIASWDGTLLEPMPDLPAWPPETVARNGEHDPLGSPTAAASEEGIRPAMIRYSAAPADWSLAADSIPASPEGKFRANIVAAGIIARLAAEDRGPSEEERASLARYAGFGAVPNAFVHASAIGTDAERENLHELLGSRLAAVRSSTPNAHYTDPAIASAIWELLAVAGLGEAADAAAADGRRLEVLEPGVGSGIFIGRMPAALRAQAHVTGIEREPIAAAVARELYPSADIVEGSYERFFRPDGSFDLAIGNVPFGNMPGLPESRYLKLSPSIHEHFTLKAVDQVRPGGAAAVLVSRWLLDRADPAVREALHDRAELVTALRLPTGAFRRSANTEAVADLLVLRKRQAPLSTLGAKALADVLELERSTGTGTWLETVEIQDPQGGSPIRVNRFLAEHPDRVLGRMERADTQFAGERELAVVDEGERRTLARRVAAAIRDHGAALAVEPGFRPAIEPGVLAAAAIAVARAKEGGFFLDADGSLMVRRGGVAVDAAAALEGRKLTARDVEAIAHALAIHDAAREVLEAQRSNLDAETRDQRRDRLNRLYDGFVERNGRLNAPRLARLMRDDPNYQLLAALEAVGPDGALEKADIFRRDVLAPAVRPDHVERLDDALALALDESSKLDAGRVGSRLGLTEEDAERRLVAEGLAFRDPELGGELQLADLYLAGDVAAKLEVARRAAGDDPTYAPNVAALERVQPVPLGHDAITARLGAAWVPAADVAAFLAETYGVDRTAVAVDRVPVTGAWSVSLDDQRLSPDTRRRWAIKEMSAGQIAERALNRRPIQVRVEGELDRGATLAARSRAEALDRAFRDWIWADPDRRRRLTALYNAKFNRDRAARLSGSWLSFPEMSAEWAAKVQDHQRGAIARQLLGNVGCFHPVGAGKTLSMTAAAIEAKRLGIASRPMIAADNPTVDAIAAAARDIYPGKRILALPGDADAAVRARFFSQIAAGDFDLAIAHHEAIDQLPMRPATLARVVERELYELDSELERLRQEGRGKGDRHVKQVEKQKAARESRLHALMSRPGEDAAVYWEDLGIDMLLVDEAEKFKNLFVATQMGEVKGLPSGDSQRAARMYARTELLNEEGGRIGFYTGTDLVNSIAEIYTWQRYLQPELLRERGIDTFDSWASVFAEIEPRLEMGAHGQFRPVVRLSGFSNLDELHAMSGRVFDRVDLADVAAVRRPELRVQQDVAPASSGQRAYMRALAARARDIAGGTVEPWQDNMLLVTSDGRKAALDLRLVEPDAPDDPESVLNRAVANALAIDRGNRGVIQTMFLDVGKEATAQNPGLRLRDDLKAKLTAGGIPADAIADFFETRSRRDMARLEADLRAGRKRIAIGSRRRLGTGRNIQDRLLVGHNLDTPIVPRDLEQPRGRGHRQGNRNSTYFEVQYLTSGTADAFAWQLLEAKLRWIEAFKRGDGGRTMTDIDAEMLTPAQIMALATGDLTVIKRAELDGRVQALEAARRRHERDVAEADRTVSAIGLRLEALDRRAPRARADGAAAAEILRDRLELRPADGGAGAQPVVLEGWTPVGEALIRAAREGIEGPVGKIGAFAVEIHGGEARLVGKGGGPGDQTDLGGSWTIRVNPESPTGTTQSLIAALRHVRDNATRLDEERRELRDELAAAQAVARKPFADAGRLDRVVRELARLDAVVSLPVPPTEAVANALADARRDPKRAEVRLDAAIDVMLDEQQAPKDRKAARSEAAVWSAAVGALARQAETRRMAPRLPEGVDLDASSGHLAAGDSPQLAERQAAEAQIRYSLGWSADTGPANLLGRLRDRPWDTAGRAEAEASGTGLLGALGWPTAPETLYRRTSDGEEKPLGDVLTETGVAGAVAEWVPAEGPNLLARIALAAEIAALADRLPDPPEGVARRLERRISQYRERHGDPSEALAPRHRALMPADLWRRATGEDTPAAWREAGRALEAPSPGWVAAEVTILGDPIGAPGTTRPDTREALRTEGYRRTQDDRVVVAPVGRRRGFGLVDEATGDWLTGPARLQLLEATTLADGLQLVATARGLGNAAELPPETISAMVREIAALHRRLGAPELERRIALNTEAGRSWRKRAIRLADRDEPILGMARLGHAVVPTEHGHGVVELESGRLLSAHETESAARSAAADAAVASVPDVRYAAVERGAAGGVRAFGDGSGGRGRSVERRLGSLAIEARQRSANWETDWTPDDVAVVRFGDTSDWFAVVGDPAVHRLMEHASHERWQPADDRPPHGGPRNTVLIYPRDALDAITTALDQQSIAYALLSPDGTSRRRPGGSFPDAAPTAGAGSLRAVQRYRFPLVVPPSDEEAWPARAVLEATIEGPWVTTTLSPRLGSPFGFAGDGETSVRLARAMGGLAPEALVEQERQAATQVASERLARAGDARDFASRDAPADLFAMERISDEATLTAAAVYLNRLIASAVNSLDPEERSSRAHGAAGAATHIAAILPDDLAGVGRRLRSVSGLLSAIAKDPALHAPAQWLALDVTHPVGVDEDRTEEGHRRADAMLSLQRALLEHGAALETGPTDSRTSADGQADPDGGHGATADELLAIAEVGGVVEHAGEIAIDLLDRVDPEARDRLNSLVAVFAGAAERQARALRAERAAGLIGEPHLPPSAPPGRLAASGGDVRYNAGAGGLLRELPPAAVRSIAASYQGRVPPSVDRRTAELFLERGIVPITVPARQTAARYERHLVEGWIDAVQAADRRRSLLRVALGSAGALPSGSASAQGGAALSGSSDRTERYAAGSRGAWLPPVGDVSLRRALQRAAQLAPHVVEAGLVAGLPHALVREVVAAASGSATVGEAAAEQVAHPRTLAAAAAMIEATAAHLDESLAQEALDPREIDLARVRSTVSELRTLAVRIEEERLAPASGRVDGGPSSVLAVPTGPAAWSQPNWPARVPEGRRGEMLSLLDHLAAAKGSAETAPAPVLQQYQPLLVRLAYEAGLIENVKNRRSGGRSSGVVLTALGEDLAAETHVPASVSAAVGNSAQAAARLAVRYAASTATGALGTPRDEGAAAFSLAPGWFDQPAPRSPKAPASSAQVPEAAAPSTGPGETTGEPVAKAAKPGGPQFQVKLPGDVATRFADVGGQDHVVRALGDFTDMLANASAYARLGAALPKGALIDGPPGTGKTELMRALAGEAGVPIVISSGAELFVGGLVGDVAENIGRLYETARLAGAPYGAAIVLIDEIDAVGRRDRGDDRTSVDAINALLVQIDGFGRDGPALVTFGLTNRPEAIDPAILRPGRLDRRLRTRPLDLAARRRILEIHARGKPLDAGVDLDVWARRTEGASGADLATLMNDAAIEAGRQRAERIGETHLEQAARARQARSAEVDRIPSRSEVIATLRDYLLRHERRAAGRGGEGAGQELVRQAGELATRAVVDWGLGDPTLAGLDRRHLSEEARRLVDREVRTLLAVAAREAGIRRATQPAAIRRSDEEAGLMRRLGRGVGRAMARIVGSPGADAVQYAAGGRPLGGGSDDRADPPPSQGTHRSGVDLGGALGRAGFPDEFAKSLFAVKNATGTNRASTGTSLGALPSISLISA